MTLDSCEMRGDLPEDAERPARLITESNFSIQPRDRRHNYEHTRWRVTAASRFFATAPFSLPSPFLAVTPYSRRPPCNFLFFGYPPSSFFIDSQLSPAAVITWFPTVDRWHSSGLADTVEIEEGDVAA